MYGVEPIFWLKLILVVAGMGLLLILFNGVMRKWLRVEKRKFLSYNHVNDQHKHIDWIIKIIFVVILFLGFIINNVNDPMERIWFLEPYLVTFIYIAVSEAARAIMEWKYSSNRNEYIFTISQLMFMSIILLSIFSTNSFGWFG